MRSAEHIGATQTGADGWRTSCADNSRSRWGALYAIERELGAGGMSRVFVAEEVALGVGRRLILAFDPSAKQLGGVSFSTDGRRIFYTVMSDESDVWAMDVAPRP